MIIKRMSYVQLVEYLIFRKNLVEYPFETRSEAVNLAEIHKSKFLTQSSRLEPRF